MTDLPTRVTIGVAFAAGIALAAAIVATNDAVGFGAATESGHLSAAETSELRERCGQSSGSARHASWRHMCRTIAVGACHAVFGTDAVGWNFNAEMLTECLSYGGNWRMYLTEQEKE